MYGTFPVQCLPDVAGCCAPRPETSLLGRRDAVQQEPLDSAAAATTAGMGISVRNICNLSEKSLFKGLRLVAL